MKVGNSTELLNLIVEGFRSYHSRTSLALDGKGLVLVKGDNGFGKSTLFEAIVWCLYKVTLKNTINAKVQTWQRLRTDKYKGTRTVLVFWSAGYYFMIARHLGFTGTTLGLDGKDKLLIYRRIEDTNFQAENLVGSEHHKDDQEAYIQQILGMDSKTFLNSMMFAQRATKLVSSDAETKRKLFDSLFDLDFIEAAKTKAAAKNTELDTEIKVLSTELTGLASKIKNARENYAANKTIIEEFNTTKTERVAAAQLKLNNKKSAFTNASTDHTQLLASLETKKGEADIVAITAAHTTAKSALDSNKNEILEIGREVTSTKRELELSKTNKQKYLDAAEKIETKCPVCKGDIKPADIEAAKKVLKDKAAAEQQVIEVFDKQLLEKDKKTKALEKLTAGLQLTYDEAKTKYDGLDTIKTQIATIEANIRSSTTNIQNMNEDIKDLQAELEKEQNAKKPDIDLEAAQIQIDADVQLDKEKTEQHINKIAKQEQVQWWIKKGFGAGGLKSFVFSAMLSKLNVHIDTYAVRLGYKCRFWIDLSKHNKPFMTTVFKGTHEIDYAELSGGQMQLLDVVVAFAMHDLVTELARVNVLILDEIFEGLSPENTEKVFDLIRMKAEAGISVFVVTHSQVIDSLGSHSMYIGFTPEEHSYIL